jgi:hypothetical protein
MDLETRCSNWTSSLVSGCFLHVLFLPQFPLKIGSIRILVGSTVCSGLFELVWLFSPAWDAGKLACQEAFFLLSFGH